jgi:hypothetical protein
MASTLSKDKLAAPNKDEPADLHIPDDYVSHTLKTTKELPPVTWGNLHQNINYLNLAILVVTPAISIWGLFAVHLYTKTLWFSILYYYITGLGEPTFYSPPLSHLISLQASPQGITGYGLTGHIMLPALWSISLLLLAPVPLKAPFTGGREATAPTTATPTLTSTHMVPTAASSGLMLAG